MVKSLAAYGIKQDDIAKVLVRQEKSGFARLKKLCASVQPS